MAITAFSGPLVISGQRPAIDGGVPPDYNQDAAPSLFYMGGGLLDPRFGYFGHGQNGYRALGFQSSDRIPVIDVAVAALAANNIAASQAAVSGTPLTLVSATGAGVVVLAAALLVMPSQNTVPKNALALDVAPGIVTFGSASGGMGFYDPTKAIARNVRVTTNGDDSSGFYNIAGYDVYGYPMTERLAGVSSGIVSGKKAFKFITSITPSGTVNSAGVVVGTGDVIGLPIRADTFGDIIVNYPSTLITATTGFTAAVTTSPATNLTGDVRGTYALQTASTGGTNRLQISVTPKLANLSITGLFGVTQA